MKRFLATLLMFPALCNAAFTEFYCNASTGSNLNGGSDAGTVTYTSTNGGWNSGTGVFTPSDGSNPVSAGVTVGQFASVYIDGASVGVFIGRVTAVTNAVNGTITVSTTAKMGSAPSTNATARTIKVGGALKGPNAASAFPFNLSAVASARNSSNDQVRINMISGTSYSITSGMSTNQLASITVQGYTTTVGDGGKAVIDGSTNAITLWTESSSGVTLADLKLVSSASSGAGSNLLFSGQGQTAIRVVATGARNVGLGTSSGSYSTFIECEAYGNNTGNNASSGGFWITESATARLIRCYSHDNTGSNSSGFHIAQSIGNEFIQCIADTNGANGFTVAATNVSSYTFANCDAYNNTGDGIKLTATPTSGQLFWIENCNFIKNGGKGINNTATTGQGLQGYVFNCGYGAGTQANGSADALGALIQTGTVTYASDVTPWVAPTTGNFSTNLAAAQGVGRSAFTETDGTNTGTIGYPDIGAAQAQVGAAFPTPTPTATPTATPTVTPTPTTPPETSHTFGG